MHRSHCTAWPRSFALRLLVVCLGVWATAARAQEPQASPESPERLEQDCRGGNASCAPTRASEDSWVRESNLEAARRTAGDALTFAAGVMMEPMGGTPHVLQLQANGGFNIMSIAGIFWSHGSWELLGFYAYKPFNLRIGGGVPVQHPPRLGGDRLIRRLQGALR